MAKETLEEFVERMACKLEALDRERADICALLNDRLNSYVDEDVMDNLRDHAEWLIRNAREGRE